MKVEPLTVETTECGPLAISKDDINCLPLYHFDGPVHIVRTEEELLWAADVLKKEKVIGFDTETRPSFSKGKSYLPSLIQMAGDQAVFLFQLKWQPLGPVLAGILEDPSIVKTGVAVGDDMAFLTKLHPFTPARTIDLADAARKNNIQNHSLRALAAMFLGVRISKNMQCSNWSMRDLTHKQVRYAATDAWVSRAIYQAMKQKGLAL